MLHLCPDFFMGYSRIILGSYGVKFPTSNIATILESPPLLAHQAPVLQKVDDAIHWLNLSQMDSAMVCPTTYPLACVAGAWK